MIGMLFALIVFCLWGLCLNASACYLISGYASLSSCLSGKQKKIYGALTIALTVCSFMAMIMVFPVSSWIAYSIFISALIITFRTDIEWMLISRLVTLYLIPVGFLFSWLQILPLSLTDAVIASISAYCFFYLVGYIFYRITHQEGLGEGDRELMAFIGAFTGIQGWWTSLLIGSLIGSCIGIIYMIVIRRYKAVKIPFGPFLVLGALAYIFLFNIIINSYMNVPVHY